MIPPKYNFYVGTADNLYFNNYSTIDDNGNITESSSSHDYSSYQIDLHKKKYMFINLNSSYYKNAIFFYDESKIYIKHDILNNYSNLDNIIIQVPDNAAFYALRFSDYDAIFAAKKNTNFVYTLSIVNPHYSNLSKKYAKESGQEFFRISLDGKISLFGEDYELIKNSSLEDQLVFIIDKYNKTSNKWNMYYKGEFSKTDCKINYDKRSCELKTIVLDDYNAVLNNYENVYDLIKLTPEITNITLNKRSLVQFYILGANSITNLFGGTYWEANVNNVVNSGDDLTYDYYFSYTGSANEFAVKYATVSGIDGVYAGTNGDWQNNKGYSAYIVQRSGKKGWIYIKSNSDNKNLYRSIEPINIYFNKGYMFIESYSGDIIMNAIEGNGVVSGICVIQNVFVYHVYRRLLCDVDSITINGKTTNTYNLPIDDFATDSRNYKKCIGLSGGTFLCTSATVDSPTKYGLNDYGKYFTNQFLPGTTGYNRPLPICRSTWANASLWYVYDYINYEPFEKLLRKQYTLKDSYSIASAIEAILKKIDPSLTHKATAEYSKFLYDTEVPIQGTERFYVFITQKTNILKGNYDQPAQKAEISLKDITEMLRDCFRCYWYIEDNKFKIEHILFFNNGGQYSINSNIQLDITKNIDGFNKRPFTYFQSELEYDKSELNQRYEFNWMDDSTDLFGGLSIDVKSNYIQKDKKEEININKFSADVDYMLFNPSAFSEDGFALLCATKDDSIYSLPIIKTTLMDENGDIYTAIVQNWYASWAYLINLYMYDMPAKNIECNMLSSISVVSIKMCMKHTIEFPSEEDLNEMQLIKTNIGNGKIDEYSIDMNTRTAKVNLQYKPV